MPSTWFFRTWRVPGRSILSSILSINPRALCMPVHDLLSLSTTSAPHVKELGIYYSIQPQPLEAITELDFSKAMPALDEIFLRGLVFSPSAGQHIPPAHLRSLNSNFWRTVDDMIEILRTMPMLEELQHETDPVTFTHGLTHEPFRVYPLRCVELKKLRQLVCSCGSFARNMLFFSYISFPLNAELHLIYPHSHARRILTAPFATISPLRLAKEPSILTSLLILLPYQFGLGSCVLHLKPDFDKFFVRTFEHSLVREIHFPSWSMLADLSVT